MLSRLPVLRTSALRQQSSSSSSAMADLSNSIRAAHQSSPTVEETANSSGVTSNGQHGAAVAPEPSRRKIASLVGIYRHLGLKHGMQCGPTTNERMKKLSRIDSIHKNSHSNQPGLTSAKDSDHKKENHLLSTSSSCSLVANNQTRVPDGTDQLSEEIFVQDDDCSRMLEEYYLPTSFGKHDIHGPRESKSTDNGWKHGAGGGTKRSKNNNSSIAINPFNICLSESEDFLIKQSESEDLVFLGASADMESVPEVDQLGEGTRQRVLRPGMVLLKNYITRSEQVFIVKKCRELGLGPGGFYQPGYKDGAKLRLHMMCLGLDWDPQTRKYQRQRRIDRSKPPDIPNGFHRLVDRAMQDSYALVRRDFKDCNVEEILPPMSPNICIVNFYTENGRLGLHQDRDESMKSLAKGLPVVSFSIGDSAEFLYGDQRDINKAENLVLDSGDVLIFGGESRHIFHGVASIIPNSAPRFLLKETGLRPGRLNLTFRQF